MRIDFRRLALIPLGLALGVVGLEVGLQVAALAVRVTGQGSRLEGMTGGRRILCLGDSNTYGLYLRDRTQAYPQQLERLWNESGAAARVEVLNLGYPGTNSSRLRRDLPRMMETFRPDVVIIMVGSDDYWTAPVPTEGEGVPARLAALVTRYSRVYQLVYMLRRALDHRRLEVVYPALRDGGSSGVARYGDAEFPMGWTKAPQQRDHDRQLDENLRTLIAQVRSFGAEPVLMTYASRMDNYGNASGFIRAAAAATGARLVDLGPVFEGPCPEEPCPDWLYPDHHPTANGYHLIAETLLHALR